MNEGFAAHTVTALSISATQSYFAGVLGDGIYRSKDKGNSWQPVGLEQQSINSIIMRDTAIYVGTDNGIYRSLDDGNTWTTHNNGLLSRKVYAFALSDSIIYAGTRVGLYRSTNNGETWTEAGLTNEYIIALDIIGTTLYAGTWGNGMFRSSDNARNWYPFSLENQDVRCFAVRSGKLFAGTTSDGVYRLSDNQSAMLQSGLSSEYIRSIMVAAGRIFAGTLTGVAYSNNDGETWKNVGFTEKAVFSFLAVDNTLFVGAEGSSIWKTDIGILTSTNEQNFSSDNIYTFPQPAQDILHISAQNIPHNSQGSILTLDGRLLHTFSLTESATFPIQHIPTGIYIITIGNTAKPLYRGLISIAR
jgi:ligand-binding sensor domain-containing protein